MEIDSIAAPARSDPDSAFERDRAELIRRARAEQPRLVEALPDAVRLTPEYDVERLVADVERLTAGDWRQQAVYAGGKVVAAVEVDWTVVPLRNIGGTVDRTDPGGPGMLPFTDTPLLERTPYLAQVLHGLPAPLRSVRLMAAGPGVTVPLHVDSSVGFPWGILRLHIPIVTNPGAVLLFDGGAQHWPAGGLWFGNFARPHQVRNSGKARRIHLVIDSYVTPGLVALFPPELRQRLVPPEALYLRPEVPLSAAELAGHACRLAVPRSFLNYGEPFGHFLRPQKTVDVALEVAVGGLVLSAGGRPVLGLVHAGDGEFRFQGWSDERTICVGKRGVVTLTTRRGAEQRTLDVRCTTAEGKTRP